MGVGRVIPAVVMAAGALLFVAPPAAAVDYPVNDFADAPDDDLTDRECHSTLGTCTLRAAVMQASQDYGIPTTITLQAGTYLLTIPEGEGTRGEAGDLLAISGGRELTIRGAGSMQPSSSRPSGAGSSTSGATTRRSRT
jgi:hypothetical protein